MTKKEDKEKAREIAEGNRMIAEFMGVAISNKNIYPYKANLVYVCDDDEFRWEEPLFHFSWDWLMPVIEKCIEIQQSNGEDEGLEDIMKHLQECDINSTWKAVIRFINVYNLPFK